MRVLLFCWRRERDSNPRYRNRYNCLAGSPVQPLQHLSIVMAEEVGFEPTDLVKGQRFSRPPHSTTLPLLHGRYDYSDRYFTSQRLFRSVDQDHFTAAPGSSGSPQRMVFLHQLFFLPEQTILLFVRHPFLKTLQFFANLFDLTPQRQLFQTMDQRIRIH